MICVKSKQKQKSEKKTKNKRKISNKKKLETFFDAMYLLYPSISVVPVKTAIVNSLTFSTKFAFLIAEPNFKKFSPFTLCW